MKGGTPGVARTACMEMTQVFAADSVPMVGSGEAGELEAEGGTAAWGGAEDSVVEGGATVLEASGVFARQGTQGPPFELQPDPAHATQPVFAQGALARGAAGVLEAGAEGGTVTAGVLEACAGS